jgi:hypothetical protein
VSRKDYIAIAEVLARASLSPAQRAELADQLGALFAADNDRFDLERFRRAAMPAGVH